MMDVKVSKDKHISSRLIKRTSSMLDEIESKTLHKDEEGDQQRKRSKTLSEIKPFENIFAKVSFRESCD